MNDPSPTLEQDERFSHKLADFVNRALQKLPEQRATFNSLLGHDFLAQFADDDHSAIYERQPESIYRHYNAIQQHRAIESINGS